MNFILLLLPFLAISQAPGKIHFQALLSEPTSAFGSNVNVSIAIKDALNNGNTIFSELQTIEVGETGLLSFDIGESSSLQQLDWSTGSHFLEISINGELLGISEIVKVPYASYASMAGNINSLDYDNLVNAPDLSNADTDPSDDFDGDYLNLTNSPQTITQEESDKVDLITATNSVDLDELASNVSVNNSKVTFPGFGTTAGTAFIQKWSKVDGNLYYPDGGAGIEVVSSSGSVAALTINQGMKVDRIVPASATPGMLFLDQASGEFKYFNENLELKDLIPTETAVFGAGLENARDVNIGSRLVVGSQEVRPPGDATLVVASNTPIIRFDDTSSSASFPFNDWEIRANDTFEGGDNYFSFVDITNVGMPFRVEPAVPSNSIFIDSNGDIKLGGNSATARLDADGEEMRGTAFVGNASGLTGLSGMGTSTVQNTGSTTIAADDDDNNDGSIIFETASTGHMVIDQDGHVGIGTAPSSEERLTVSGVSQASEISVDPSTTSFDVTGIGIVVFTAKPAGFVQPFTSNRGQELIIINTGTEAIDIFHSPSGFTSIPQYGSITLVFSDNGWIVKYRSI